MSPEHPPPARPRLDRPGRAAPPASVVIVFLALGRLAGWLYAAPSPTTYTSTARVLVNPSVGNPFVPTPSSVRQDELTSLETEAQVVRSAEVLDAVAAQVPGLTTGRARARRPGHRARRTPRSSRSPSPAADPVVAQQVADAVADAYLDNRARRFDEVNAARIDAWRPRPCGVVNDLRAATDAAQVGTRPSGSSRQSWPTPCATSWSACAPSAPRWRTASPPPAR